jgi:hypothetical protein
MKGMLNFRFILINKGKKLPSLFEAETGSPKFNLAFIISSHTPLILNLGARLL